MKTAKKRITLCILLICLLATGSYGVALGLNQNKHSEALSSVSNAILLGSGDVSPATLEDLNFTLINGGQSYKVSVRNRSLQEALIPSSYNGLPVTEISDNAFMSCQSLVRVFVPSTVTRIGNNAFMNCTKLERVVGMSRVTTYGNNAFSMCAKLDKLMLPAGITSLGTSVIKNINNPVYARASEEVMSDLNPSWNYNSRVVFGNNIVCENYTNDAGVEGYRILPYQNLNSSNEPLTIYSWYHEENDTVGKPLLAIGAYAFNGVYIPSITIRHPEGSNLSHKIEIGEYAFAFTDTDFINILTDIELTDVGNYAFPSESVFYGSSIQSVTLPNSLTLISKMMFGDCLNLREIKNVDPAIETNHLSDKITRINEEAFYNCYSLPEIYIDRNIEYIGDSAFNMWGTNPDVSMPIQNIYIDTVEESPNWGTLWNNGFNSDRCNLEFTGATEYFVTFSVEQANVIDPAGYEVKSVPPRIKLSELTDITVPTSTSHSFTGVWYTTAERTPGTEFPADKQINKNMTLYAGWTIKSFDRVFPSNKYGVFYDAITGEQLSGKTKTFEYGQSIQFYIIMNPGYENPVIIHDNVESIPNSGNIYTIKIEKEATISVSGDLTKFTISYKNLRGGTHSNNPTEFTVETPTIFLEAPSWVAYYNAAWDKPIILQGTASNQEITAVWTNPVPFTIRYENAEHAYNPNPAQYTVESPTIELMDPQWAAYNNGTWNRKVIESGSVGVQTITAIWTNPKEFKISYKNLLEGYNPNEHITSYTILTPTIYLKNPVWAAYDNASWDISVIEQGKYWEDLEIRAQWSKPHEFNIIIKDFPDGAVNPNAKMSFNFETPTFTLEAPTWAAYKSGSWDKAVIEQGTYENVVISALWSNPVVFTIQYFNLRGGKNPYGNPKTYTVETPTITLEPPTWIAYRSRSWNIESIPQGSWGNKIIDAVWADPVTFTITYELIGNATNSNSRRSYTVESETFAVQQPGGTHTTGYKYMWNRSSTVEKGSYGNIVFKAEPTPIRYWINLRYTHVSSPSANSIGSIFARYDESYIIEKTILNQDPKWYMAYYRDSDGPDAANHPIELTNNMSTTVKNLTTVDGDTVHIVVGEKACVAEGTLITLSDGTQKPVEQLTGNETLLVWNLQTGAFDTAPILFIDKEIRKNVEITHLYFSDGTEVKVIYEHAFWDIDLNQYVFLRNDAARYIGHKFNKQVMGPNGVLTWTSVQLVDVKVYQEMNVAYSPVTAGHLCYYVNGMLSMPGATEGLINIFDVDADTMKINEAAYKADIEKYGLFTYEEFAEILPIPEEVFEAFGGKYLKVSIGKGLITYDKLAELIQRYSKFF